MDFKDIKNDTDIVKYLEEKSKGHYHYRRYLKCEYISDLISDKYLYFSDGSKWDDTLDKNNLNNNNDDYKCFACCFSFSMSENVALWKLFANKQGGMIDFKKKHIIQLVELPQEIEIGNIDNKQSFRKLISGQYEIFMTDILYYGDCDKKDHDSKTEYRIKHSDNPRKYINKEFVDKLGFCKKTIPWSFEKESRLIVKVNKDIIVGVKDNSVRIKLHDNIIEDLKNGHIISSPIVSRNAPYVDSTLKDKVDWKEE